MKFKNLLIIYEADGCNYIVPLSKLINPHWTIKDTLNNGEIIENNGLLDKGTFMVTDPAKIIDYSGKCVTCFHYKKKCKDVSVDGSCKKHKQRSYYEKL